MTFEEFKEAAEDLGCIVEVDTPNVHNFLIDNVGVAHYNGMYAPIGHAYFRHWTDEILSDQLRYQVLVDKTPEMALDYLELLISLERIKDEV